MKARLFHIFVVCLGWFLYSTALTRAKDYRTLSSEYVPGESNSGANSLQNEPTCEELREMWRFSKRQSRAAEITNEIPTYRDPFAHNVWEEYARPRSAGRGRYRKPPIYGRIVHSSNSLRTIPDSPARIRSFEEVARLFSKMMRPNVGPPRRLSTVRFVGRGGGDYLPAPAAQAGRFQHLKEIIKSERARELQEHRMSEEAERSRHFYKPQQVSGGQAAGDKIAAPSRGVVTFPDIMIPSSSRYMDDYAVAESQNPSVKYKSRYPEFNTIS